MSSAKTLIFLSLLLSILLKISVSHGQSTLMFNHLTAEDGLTTNNVRTFVQDHQGFIWIGTESGLQRYDGYEFELYKNAEGDSNSIRGNFILSLFEDSKKQLWVGTLEGGLSLYNRKNDSFYNYVNIEGDSSSIFGNSINTISETPDGLLWIGTEQGGISYIDLDDFNPQKPVFNNISLPAAYIDEGALWISSVFRKDDGVYWITVHGAGLVSLNIEEKSFFKIITEKDYDVSQFDNRLIGIYTDSKNRLWLASWGGGLYLFFPEIKKLINYRFDSKNPSSIPNNLITSMLEDHEGNFWVGTDNGLCQMTDFDQLYPEGIFKTYTNDPFIANSLKTNAVKFLYQDRQNRLWVATYFGGVNVYDPDFFRFTTIRNHPLLEGSLPGNNITAIEEDEMGNIWIGTDNNGLCMVPNGVNNVTGNKFVGIPLRNSTTGVLEKKIKSLQVSSTGKIWIGTWGGGLFCYDAKSVEITHFEYDRQEGLLSESVLSIAIDDKENIWAGTFNGGLTYLNPKTNEFTTYRHSINDANSLGNDKVNSLLIDKNKDLWIGTEGGGLNFFDSEVGNIQRINIGRLISSLTIISLYQCHDGYIWVGTHSNGLFRLNPDTYELRQYTTDFGISGDLIQSISEDNAHYLWISTNNGISKFVFSQNTVTNYSVQEGLQSKQFNPNSVFRCQDGLMIFGGVNGMNAFYPESIKKSEEIPNLVFTDLFIDNTEVGVRTEGSPLKENIVIAEGVKLKYFQNSLSIEYASLEYDFANRSRYMTYLEGFDEGWQSRGAERKVTYTNLDAGEYKLHVKSINKDGFISDNIKTLEIDISPAWYQTKLFWGALLVFIVGIAYLIIHLRINLYKRQSQKLEAMVSLRTRELRKISNEILAQNEELSSQNDQISEQREELKSARDQLTILNTELEKLVKKRTKKLEKTVNELDRFVYSASHDLSAPLKSVLGLLNIAKIDQDKSRAKEYLDYMEDSILKLEDVIKSLISYSRNSRLEIKKEEINLKQLVWSVINELAFLTTDNIKYFVNIPEDQIIFTDHQRIKIILHNLINNCIKYADFGKAESTVHISLEKATEQMKIIIQDNGIGIEKDQLKKIFSMFYRATEKSSGSGLGLYIVKETAATLGGKIKVTSTPNVKTEFTVILPS